MKTEIPTFENGVYNKACEFFPKIAVGSVLCVGHSELPIKKCKFCVSCKQENTYYMEILKEYATITSEVVCSRPGAQLLIF
jgi:hypothetical protein